MVVTDLSSFVTGFVKVCHRSLKSCQKKVVTFSNVPFFLPNPTLMALMVSSYRKLIRIKKNMNKEETIYLFRKKMNVKKSFNPVFYYCYTFL